MRSQLMGIAIPFLCLLTGSASAGIKADELIWPIPEPATRTYDVEYVSTDVTKGVERKVQATYLRHIESSKTDQGYLQVWRDTDIVLDMSGFEPEHKRLMEDAIKASANIPLKVALDKDAAYASLVNIDEWSEVFKQQLGRAMQAGMESALQKVPADKREAAKAAAQKQGDALMAIMSSPAYVRKQLETVPFLFNFFNTGGLDPKQAYALESTTENPIGGTPFPVNIHFEITEYEDEPGYVYGLYRSTLDPKKGRPAMVAAVKRIIGDDSSATDAEIEKALKEFEVSVEANLRVVLETGVVDWIEIVETKKFPDSVETTTTEMSLRQSR